MAVENDVIRFQFLIQRLSSGPEMMILCFYLFCICTRPDANSYTFQLNRRIVGALDFMDETTKSPKTLKKEGLNRICRALFVSTTTARRF